MIMEKGAELGLSEPCAAGSSLPDGPGRHG